MESTLLSFYIPRININFTKTEVRNNLENRFIDCNIERIDFVSILNLDKIVNPNYRSAFIHMYLRNLPSSIELYKTTYVEEAAFKFYLNNKSDSYWLLLKNKFPVPETELNLSQVVENARLLEERVAKQEEIIEYQATKIEKIESVVYQLLGGLFNHRTQDNFLEKHLTALLDNNEVCWSPTNGATKSKWAHYPTTRQGDECERRVEALEQTVRDMLNFDFPETQEHYDEAELLHRCNINYIHNNDNASLSTHSSMPDLIDASSDNSGERIRNSIELCGNE